MEPKTDRWLRRVALAVSLTLVASVTATAVVVMWPRVTRAMGMTPPPPEPAYRAGQTIDTPLEWAQTAEVTLVLFAQSSCGACQKAKPFLKDLFAELKDRAAVLLASHGPDRTVEEKYRAELGLDAAAFRVTPEGLRVRATPTLVLVDRSGKILEAWEGVGPEPQQKLIREKIVSAVADARSAGL